MPGLCGSKSVTLIRIEHEFKGFVLVLEHDALVGVIEAEHVARRAAEQEVILRLAFARSG